MNIKALRIATLILFFINLVLIFLVDMFTLELSSGHGASESGNPALILWLIELPAYLLLLAGIAFIVHQERYLLKYSRIGVSLLLLALLVVSILLQVDKAQRIHERLEGAGNAAYWLNSYTNTIYINFYSFLSGILLLLLIQSVITLIRLRVLGGKETNNK